jgi:hypothetical protein
LSEDFFENSSFYHGYDTFLASHFVYKKMQTLFDRIKQIEIQDTRQKGKIRHKIGDIVGVALFATMANAEDCET